MVNFFVKSGRPSKEEKAIAEKIQAILSDAEKNGNKEIISAVEAQGAVYNLDGLKKIHSIITGQKNNSNNSNNNTMGKVSENDTEKEEKEKSSPLSGSHETEDVKFEEVSNIAEDSQFQQPPIERENAYEKYAGTGGGEGSGEGGAEDFEEPRNQGEGLDESEESEESEEGGGGSGGGGDIPDHTKKLSNAKIAKMVGEVYVKVLPILPKRIAKISDTKIEKMERYDELSMSMRLKLPEGGETTVRRYIEHYNASLEEQLIVTPEMQKDFRVALKDMLDEKKVDATPTQVFLGTVVSQLAIIGITAAEQMAVMNRHLAYWKECHEENKEASRPKKNPPPSPQQPVDKTPPPPPPPPPPHTKSDSAHDDDDIQSENEEMSINPKTVEEK